MTAREIVLALPSRLKADEAEGKNGTFHFQLEGENGGDFTVKVADGVCTVEEGLNGEADCVISALASDFEDAEEDGDPVFLQKTDWKTIKATIDKEVNSLLI